MTDEEITGQPMAKKSKYVFFLYQPFMSWLIATAEFTYADPQLKSRLAAFADSRVSIAVGAVMAVIAGNNIIKTGNVDGLSALLSALSFGKAAWNAGKSRKQEEFTLTPAKTNKIQERKEAHIDGYLQMTPEEYMGNQFKKVKQYWDINMPSLSYKLVKSVNEKLKEVKELEMQKQEAFIHSGCPDPNGRTEQEVVDFRHTIEGVKIEDKYARQQIKVLSGITKEYFEAANYQNRRLNNNPEKYEKLIDMYDVLDQAVKNYTGSAFWAGEEVIDDEKGFSFSRFSFDINQEKIYKRINESAYKKQPFSEAHKKLADYAEQNPIIHTKDENGCDHNILVLPIDPPLDTEKFDFEQKEEGREAEFNSNRAQALNSFRTIMFELNQLENKKADGTAKNILLGYTKNRIFNKQQLCVEKLADVLKETGYKEEANLVTLAGVSAADLYYNFGQGAQSYKRVTERGIIIPDEKQTFLEKTAQTIKAVPQSIKEAVFGP